MSTKVIYKYEAGFPGGQHLIPPGYRVLCAQEQDGKIQVWVEQDMFTTGTPRRVGFFIVPTGVSFDSDMTGDYVGTVLLEGGAYVFHIYAKEN